MSDRYEDNDSRLSASPLGNLQGVGSIVNLSIDDEDWFEFTLATPGTASSAIGLDFLHADGDVDLQLLNANGGVIGSSTSTSNSESISLNGLAAGTYFIRAYGFSGATNPQLCAQFQSLHIDRLTYQHQH
ncbi:MAG: T9SS type A sorting domain-containing protein [Leptolyngbyaceae cyanobacterium SM1_3_5]|nr:T9SS type A sorting domain-containing protein [Leptolyngbyaceae cyanobacterium SM1_3_5]